MGYKKQKTKKHSTFQALQDKTKKNLNRQKDKYMGLTRACDQVTQKPM